MALLPDQKFSTFQAGGDIELGDIIVGLRSGINTQFTWSLPAGVDTLIGTLNEVLVNGTVGVPQTGNVTLSLPQPIATTSSPTFANLQLTGGTITDVNGNNVLQLIGLSSAVNFLQIYNGATTKNPTIVATGSDSTVDLAFASKGARFAFVDSVFGSGNFPIIRLSDSTQTNHMNLSLTAGLASEYTILFPNASGTVALVASSTQTFNGDSGSASPSAGVITFTGSTSGLTFTGSGSTMTLGGILTAAHGGTGLSALGTGVQTALGQNVSGSGGMVLTTSPTITTPRISQINDSNGNEIFELTTIPSAVNYIQIFNQATGMNPGMQVKGSDTNISYLISSKGNGQVAIYGQAFSSQIAGFFPLASGVNYFSFTNAATGNSPVLGAVGSDSDIIFQLNGKGTGGVQIQGTFTNNNAPSGYIGEYLTNSAGSTGISNNTATNIVTLSLTAGDWDVWGGISYSAAGGALVTTILSGTSSASASISNLYQQLSGVPFTSNSVNVLSAPANRISISTTTTVYLVGFASFTVGTVATTGIIAARRMR